MVSAANASCGDIRLARHGLRPLLLVNHEHSPGPTDAHLDYACYYRNARDGKLDAAPDPGILVNIRRLGCSCRGETKWTWNKH
jgi:hypothetical protein